MSQSFKDKAGREWVVTLDVFAIKRAQALTGVEIGRFLDDDMKRYRDLIRDPVKFVDVVFALCREQADRLGVTEEMFFRAIDGDVLEDAHAAFEEAFANFCPRHLRRILEKASQKARVATEEAAAKVLEQMDRPPAGPATSSKSATGSAASSESIPPG